MFYLVFVVNLAVFLLFLRTEDAEVIYDDADKMGMISLDWAWIVSEQALAADNIPIGE